jgi:hypothetical protein
MISKLITIKKESDDPKLLSHPKCWGFGWERLGPYARFFSGDGNQVLVDHFVAFPYHHWILVSKCIISAQSMLTGPLTMLWHPACSDYASRAVTTKPGDFY